MSRHHWRRRRWWWWSSCWVKLIWKKEKNKRNPGDDESEKKVNEWMNDYLSYMIYNDNVVNKDSVSCFVFSVFVCRFVSIHDWISFTHNINDNCRIVENKKKTHNAHISAYRHIFIYCIHDDSWRFIWITLSWSIGWKICGASNNMAMVPNDVIPKNRYNCKRSITMATYFQSSRI